jgi:hypothetical protein
MKSPSAIPPGLAFDLVARPPLAVRFEGSGGRAGPLTLGQINILRWLSGGFEQPGAYISRRLEIPRGARLEDVAESLAVLMARHEALRTRFAAGERPRQLVPAGGVLPVGVYELAPGGAGVHGTDRDELAAELGRRLRDEAAARPGPMPVRVALATAEGGVIAGAICYSHMAVDDWAVTVVGREFAELLLMPSARRVGPVRHQPVDQATLEQGAAMGDRVDATLAYWQRLLLRMPQCLYAAPRVGPDAPPMVVEMSSPAATAAAGHIAARTRTSRSSAFLAAICALLAHRTGYRKLVFPSLSGNRFERHLTEYVGTLVQSALTVVDTEAPSFDQFVSRAWAASVQSGRHGMYDANQCANIVRRVERDQGVHFDIDPLFNSSIHDGVVAPAAEHTTLRAREIPATPTMIRFNLFHMADDVVLALRVGDTSRIPVGDAEALLRAVERLLVAAADSDLVGKRIDEAIGMDQIPRGADWFRAGPHWVEESEVRRLVRDALAPNPCQVFRDTPFSGGRLVAYVAASESLRTPAQAHDRCMAALPGRPTAIAPQRYVVCEGAPVDPQDEEGWRLRALRDGAGR